MIQVLEKHLKIKNKSKMKVLAVVKGVACVVVVKGVAGVVVVKGVAGVVVVKGVGTTF